MSERRTSTRVEVRSNGIENLNNQTLVFDIVPGTTVDDLMTMIFDRYPFLGKVEDEKYFLGFNLENPFVFPTRNVDDCFFSALQATRKDAYAYDARVRVVLAPKDHFAKAVKLAGNTSTDGTSPSLPATIANSSNAALRRLAALKAKNSGSSTSTNERQVSVSDDTSLLNSSSGVENDNDAPQARRFEAVSSQVTDLPRTPSAAQLDKLPSSKSLGNVAGAEVSPSNSPITPPLSSSGDLAATSAAMLNGTQKSAERGNGSPSSEPKVTIDEKVTEFDERGSTSSRKSTGSKLAKAKANSDFSPMLKKKTSKLNNSTPSEGSSTESPARKKSDSIRNIVSFISPGAEGVASDDIKEHKRQRSTPLWKLKAQAQLNRSLSRSNLFVLDPTELTPGELELLEAKRKLIFESKLEARKIQVKVRYQRRENSSPSCFSCLIPILPGERFIEHEQHKVHLSCFTCSQCSKSLEGEAYVLVEENFFDIPHWNAIQESSEEKQEEAILLARQKRAKTRAKLALEYEQRKKETIAAMEHQEKLKIVDALDADLQSDIEQIRKRKMGRNKSIVGYEPEVKPESLQKNLSLVLSDVDKTNDVDVLKSPKPHAGDESSDESGDSDGDAVPEHSKISSVSSNPGLEELPRDFRTSNSRADSTSSGSSRRNTISQLSFDFKKVSSKSIALSLNRKQASRHLDGGSLPTSPKGDGELLPKDNMDDNGSQASDRTAPKTRKRANSFSAVTMSKPSRNFTQTSDVVADGFLFKSKTSIPNKTPSLAKETGFPSLDLGQPSRLSSTNDVFLSPRSRLKTIKRNKSDDEVTKAPSDVGSESQSLQKRLYSLSDVLRVAPTVPGSDTQAYWGIEPKISGNYVGLNRRVSRVCREENLRSEVVDAKAIITASTAEAMINEVTSREIPDEEIVRNFLYIYPYLLNSTELLKKIRKRWNYDAPKDSSVRLKNDYNRWRLTIRYRVLNLIKRWIVDHSYYFLTISLYEKMMKFLQSQVKPFNREWFEELHGHLMMSRNLGPRLLTRFRTNSAAKNISPSKSKNDIAKRKKVGGKKVASPKIPTSARSERPPESRESSFSGNADSSDDDDLTDFTRFSAKKFARQLTLHENGLIRAIKPDELLGARWKNADKHEKAPNVTRMIDWFNNVTAWVTTEIVCVEDLKSRAQVLLRFIEIAQFCLKFHNYNSVMEILGALNSIPVRRLKLTWDLIPKKDLKFVEQIRHLMNHENNFINYRNHLQALGDEPKVPFIGLILQDIFNMNELPSKITGSTYLLNYRKLTMIATALHKFTSTYQRYEFMFEPDHDIQFFFDYSFRIIPENDRMTQSKKIEVGPASRASIRAAARTRSIVSAAAAVSPLNSAGSAALVKVPETSISKSTPPEKVRHSSSSEEVSNMTVIEASRAVSTDDDPERSKTLKQPRHSII